MSGIVVIYNKEWEFLFYQKKPRKVLIYIEEKNTVKKSECLEVLRCDSIFLAFFHAKKVKSLP